MAARVEPATIVQQLSSVATIEGLMAPLAAIIQRCEELLPEGKGLIGDAEERAALKHLRFAAGFLRDSRILRGLK